MCSSRLIHTWAMVTVLLESFNIFRVYLQRNHKQGTENTCRWKPNGKYYIFSTPETGAINLWLGDNYL